jgi:hypothetical protein
MTTVAAEYGCRDGSGADRVIKRLEEKAKSDRVQVYSGASQVYENRVPAVVISKVSL